VMENNDGDFLCPNCNKGHSTREQAEQCCEGSVEVLGFDTRVHYRRPPRHKDVIEALSTPGYAVRASALQCQIIEAAIIETDKSFDIPLKLERGRFLAGPVAVSYEQRADFLRRLFIKNGGPLVI